MIQLVCHAGRSPYSWFSQHIILNQETANAAKYWTRGALQGKGWEPKPKGESERTKTERRRRSGAKQRCDTQGAN
eukprot:3789041-Pleurochrysis_carterae.AAC.1